MMPGTETGTETQQVVAPHPVLAGYYSAASERQAFVNDLFDRTASHYDAVTQAMSLGTGRLYRRRVLRRLGLRPGQRLLDVATGTGQMARAALDLGLAPRDVIGIDPSLGMLRANRHAHGTRVVRGLGERLPFASESFDCLIMGYALRHVPDLLQTFREFRRVLKPDGRLAVLEIGKPTSRLLGALTRGYLKHAVPLLARLRTGSRAAADLMRYYWDTIDACLPPERILGALRQAGFVDARRLVTGGIFSEFVA
jgi:demethylmenaquinone methyltransferase/2-methoxy-6-polyprenyl-1,4-benzoquinol methylase